jgi:hypothetical protein
MDSKKGRTEARLKPSRACVNSCSSMADIQGTWFHDRSSRELAALPLWLCSPHGLFPGLACCYFSLHMFHIPGISNILGCPLQLRLPLVVSYITLSGVAYRDLDLSCLPGLPGLPLKSGWKPPQSHNLCILHVCKRSITWTMLESAASLTVARPPWTTAAVGFE